MNSATKVGEIFTKAGESFHKMADMTMMLDAKAQELNASSDKKQVMSYFQILKYQSVNLPLMIDVVRYNGHNNGGSKISSKLPLNQRELIYFSNQSFVNQTKSRSIFFKKN